MRNTTGTAFIVVASFAAYAAGLIAIALTVEPATQEWLFSESGPFEIASKWLWFAVALICALGFRAEGRDALILGLAALLLGLREADWHHAFTTDSLFKINYYQMTDVSLLERIPAGIVAIAAIAFAGYLAVRAWILLVHRGRWREPWGAVLLAGALALPILKVVDRAPSKLHGTYDVDFSPLALEIIASQEEGLEMALPLLFLAALLMYRDARAAAGRAAAARDATHPGIRRE